MTPKWSYALRTGHTVSRRSSIGPLTDSIVSRLPELSHYLIDFLDYTVKLAERAYLRSQHCYVEPDLASLCHTALIRDR
jgi:hypothetical protein